MWPSLPTANHIADVANWFFIGSLVVGVVSTILIVWMAGVKESYWEQDRTESTERIASLVVQGDQLRKDTAQANERAEEERLARVKIEERIAWRKLDAGQATQVLSVAKQFSGQEYALTVSVDPEAMNLMGIVDEILQAAEWVRVKPFGIITTFADRASVGMKTGPLSFHIAVSKGDSPLKGVAIRMAQIFEAVGIKSEPALDPEIEKRPTAINVVIASKPF
jgi:hypothetical protein